MRRISAFYHEHAIWVILAATFSFVGFLLFVVLPWISQPPQTPEGRPINPWQVEGLKEGNQPLVWVDPQTRCQYLVSYGFSFTMTPRMGEDGRTQLCNRPELERH